MATITEIKNEMRKPSKIDMIRLERLFPGTIAKKEEADEVIRKKEESEKAAEETKQKEVKEQNDLTKENADLKKQNQELEKKVKEQETPEPKSGALRNLLNKLTNGEQ